MGSGVGYSGGRDRITLVSWAVTASVLLPAEEQHRESRQGPRQRLQLAAPSAAAAGSPDRPCTRARTPRRGVSQVPDPVDQRLLTLERAIIPAADSDQ